VVLAVPDGVGKLFAEVALAELDAVASDWWVEDIEGEPAHLKTTSGSTCLW